MRSKNFGGTNLGWGGGGVKSFETLKFRFPRVITFPTPYGGGKNLPDRLEKVWYGKTKESTPT